MPAEPSVSLTTGSPLFSGTIELEPSADAALPTSVFVIARAEGLPQGQPLLAKRFEVQSFPLKFSLGPEDSMMGQPAPARMSLEARVDRDGDATTREPGAPAASLDSVAAGTTGVKLVLRNRREQ